jgi:hypothetical protein
VLDLELVHREVLRVAGRQARTGADGGSRYQAVRLSESDCVAREVAAPSPSELTLGATERRNAQASEEASHGRFLIASGAAQDLLDVDRADTRHLPTLAQPSDPIGRRQSPQRVDQNRRIE